MTRLIKRVALAVVALSLVPLTSGCGTIITAANCSGPFDYVHHSHHVDAMMNATFRGTCYQQTYKVSVHTELQQRVGGQWTYVSGSGNTFTKYNVPAGDRFTVSSNAWCAYGDYRAMVIVRMQEHSGDPLTTFPTSYSSKLTRDPCIEPEQYLDY